MVWGARLILRGKIGGVELEREPVISEFLPPPPSLSAD